MAGNARGSSPAVAWLGDTQTTAKPYVLTSGSQQSVITRPLSEYASPVRLGQPEDDDRLPASTLSFHDLAAGVGRFLPDSRQEANRAWRSTADTRWASIISLPPKLTTKTPASQPAATGGAASFFYSDLSGTPYLHMAVGNAIYRYESGAWAQKFTLGSGTVTTTRVQIVHTGLSGGSTLVIWMRSDSTYSCTDDPSVSGNWAQVTFSASAVAINDVMTHPESGVVLVLNPVAAYLCQLSATTIISQTPGPTYAPSHGHFLGNLLGVLYYVDKYGQVWGVSATGSGTNWTYTASAVNELNDITCGTVYSGQLVVSNGRKVWLWHPSRPIRDITIGAPDGLAADQVGVVRTLFAYGDRLLALCDKLASNGLILWEFKGGGWHFVQEANDVYWYGTTSGTNAPIYQDQGLALEQAALRVWCAARDAGSLGVTTRYNTLPVGGDVPYIQEQLTAGDGFESTGEVETGWHYMGLKGLSGPFLRQRLLDRQPDGHVAVTASYMVDDDTDWTELGVMDRATTELAVASGKGVEFQRIRFKWVLSQTGGSGGGTSALSPNAAVQVSFAKVPAQKYSHILSIDLAATARRQRLPQATVLSNLTALAEARTLTYLQFGDEASTWVKLAAPQLAGYVDETGRMRGMVTLVGNELT